MATHDLRAKRLTPGDVTSVVRLQARDLHHPLVNLSA